MIKILRDKTTAKMTQIKINPMEYLCISNK